MKPALQIITIIIAVLLTLLILMQGKGAGLGSAWGGGGEFYQTRRGMEKFTLQLTVIFTLLFFIVSVLNFFAK